MSDLGPYSNYRLTARLELKNKPAVFASVTALLAKEGANLGAVDIVDATSEAITRDITFDVANEQHGQDVIAKIKRLRSVKVVSVSDRIFLFHLGGKLEVKNKIPITTRNRLSMVYTPGVARVSQAIARKPSDAWTLTIKRNCVAVVSDGSAVLGLGNLGAEAALPVMEGKAMIFKEFADINAWPICLASQDVDDIVETVKNIAPSFGGINLEDISAPRCFEIEDRLKEELDIPVMHDDQHGTAIAILAALKNALKIVKKDIKEIRVVVIGMGAAGIATCRMLLAAGVRQLKGCNTKGLVLDTDQENLRAARKSLQKHMAGNQPSKQSYKDVLEGADVLIGLSIGNILTGRDLKKMAKHPIVFAMANPDPEIDPNEAMKVCEVFATGRTDLPNQINNALAFPGVFRGALDVRARAINEKMKLAAARAIANLIKPDQLNPDYIIPSVFDRRVVDSVAEAVAKAAHATGVHRRK